MDLTGLLEEPAHARRRCFGCRSPLIPKHALLFAQVLRRGDRLALRQPEAPKLPKLIRVLSPLLPDGIALLQRGRTEDRNLDSGKKVQFHAGVDIIGFALFRLPHGHQVLHGRQVRKVIVTEKPELLQCFGASQLLIRGALQDSAGHPAHVLQRPQKVRGHLLCVRLSATVDRGDSGLGARFSLRVFRPGLDHMIGVQRSDDLAGAHARRKAADMVTVPMRRDDNVQLTAALRLDVLRDLLHIIFRPVLGGRSAAVIHQHVAIGLGVVKCDEEAIAKTDVVHSNRN